MAIIGTFTRTADGNSFSGNLRTLTHSQASVRPGDQQEQRQRSRLPHRPGHDRGGNRLAKDRQGERTRLLIGQAR
jgi:uncharacterized protein (DUF736 family)